MSPSPLVTTDWLAAHLADPHLRIVDIRGHVLPATEPPPHYFNHRADYDHSHIPGAVFVDWVQEITDPDSPLHARIARPERYGAVMSRIGVGAETLVVAYDDAEGMFAARLWWSLNYYGHERVAVLDGGWKQWTAEGRPVTAEQPAIRPAVFVPRPNPRLYRDADQVAAALAAGVRVVDVRSKAEYDGQASRARRAGHIPGALNRPRRDLVSPEGTMPAPEALRALFARDGINDPAQEVIFYCNAGVAASYGLLALRAAGYENGAVYDGSWKDWGNDDARPIA